MLQDTRWKPLASKVLAVASIHRMHFSVYVDVVEGINHEKEWQAMFASGRKQPEAIARAIFPEILLEYAD